MKKSRAGSSANIQGEANDGPTKLSMFKGVFVPTLQNIMGIILFVRLPWITGQAGIMNVSFLNEMDSMGAYMSA